MKYLAVASGAYSDYSINLFLRVPDDFNLSDKVREFAAKTGMEWVKPDKPSGNDGFFKWPDFDGSWEDESADRRRRTREAGAVFDDALHSYSLCEKSAFFLWLQQQPGIEVVSYEEQSVGDYSGLVP